MSGYRRLVQTNRSESLIDHREVGEDLVPILAAYFLFEMLRLKFNPYRAH